jgi:hypothetical protein
MIQVDINSLQLDAQVKANLDTATDRLRQIATLEEKYRYIKNKSELWRSTLGSLARLTDSTEDDCKCWYCECDGAEGFYFQVDHFRPKQRVKNKGAKKDEYEPGYWWLAFNPQNYRIACQKCNTGSGKIDQFPRAEDSIRAIIEGGETHEKPLLLDPAVATDPTLLMFSQDGNIYPVPYCDDTDSKRVNVSIKVYNLRARSKREGRRKIWDQCKNAILAARQARDNIKSSMLASPDKKTSNKKEFTDACGVIYKMTRRNAKFSSTAKSCIKEYHKVERAKSQPENLEFDLDWLLDLL